MKTMIRLWPVLIGLLALGPMPVLTAKSAPSSKTTETPEFDPLSGAKTVKPYAYAPYDNRFWESVQKRLNGADGAGSALDMAEDRIDESEKGSAHQAEGWLALGLALKKMNYPMGAFLIFKRIAVGHAGQDAGQEALHQMDLLARDWDLDEQEIEALVVAYDFYNLHPEIQSFASYHRSLHHLRHGLRDWFVAEEKLVAAGSFWKRLWDFELLMQKIGLNAEENPREALNRVIDDALTPEQIRQKAILQRARIHFETGLFEKAFADYRAFRPQSLRDQGRILLEMAWTQFYLKDFSRALGILESLKVVFYDASLTPERYILEALIYRQLCHYGAVNEVLKQFERTFRKPLVSIRQRKPLSGEVTLARMALMNPRFQKLANVVHNLRAERERLGQISLSGETENLLTAYYASKDKELRHRQDLLLEEETRRTAEELLDAEEQMTFLSYSARIDSLRIVRQGEERTYHAEAIPELTFEKFYWPVKREHWLDELPDYKVLISSRCQAKTAAPAAGAPE